MGDEHILELDSPEPEWRFRELRAESDSREVFGLLVPYNVEAIIGGGVFREVVDPGVFGDVSQLNSVLTRQHKRELTLGRTNRNVVLTDTTGGVQMRATLPKTPLAEETLQLVREGILTGLSVEWKVTRAKWERGSPPLRRVQSSLLTHFSVVDEGAYEAATISARAKAYFDDLLTPEQERPSGFLIRAG